MAHPLRPEKCQQSMAAKQKTSNSPIVFTSMWNSLQENHNYGYSLHPYHKFIKTLINYLQNNLVMTGRFGSFRACRTFDLTTANSLNN